MIRHFFLLILMTALSGPTAAADFGNTTNDTKPTSHIGQNPGTPDGREGGEDMDTAVIINALPFSDTGNTSDNIPNYPVTCPWESFGPDVVYGYTPATDEVISVDLCGSGYDTVLSIRDGALNLIACNDDFYFNDPCGNYVSRIEEAYLIAGTEYFIIVGGYGSDAGDYILTVELAIIDPPCTLTCEGLPEEEPPLGPDYEDAYNGGCNSPEFGNPIQDHTFSADINGTLIYCGISGWYPGSRDTDWMHFAVGAYGIIEWTLDAEQQVDGYLLGGDCASGITVDQEITAGPCQPATMTIQGNPGTVVLLWVGPTEYSAPPGFSGYEFNYVCDFTGLAPGVVPTTEFSFDAIKTMYR